MKPSIAIDCRMWNASGIGTYLQNIVTRLISQMPDAEFVLLGNEGALNDVCAENASVRRLAVPIYSVQEQWAVPLAIPTGTTLFWAPHYNVPVFLSVPLLVTIHDAAHVAMPELFPGWRKRIYSAVMFRAALQKAQKILTVSQFTANELQRLFGIWAVPEQIQVISNGVDQAWYSIPPQERPHERGYLLYVGNVKPHKNLRGLVAAFGLMLDYVDLDLLIVGEKEGFLTGDYELMETAQKYGDRVHFTGRVSFELLQQYYAHAMALVLPSFYEGFGLTALEAMAAGCPVAASRAASLPEVCGDAAIYFDPSDVTDIAAVLLRRVSADSLRQNLIVRGRKNVQDYSWDIAAGKTVEAMRSILK